MTKRHTKWRAVLLSVLLLSFCAAVPAWGENTDVGQAAGQAQQIIDQAPVTLEQFASDPFQALKDLLGDTLLPSLRREAAGYGRLLLFLLLSGGMMLFLPSPQPALELICCAGAFMLLAAPVLQLTTEFCSRIATWRSYLVSFIPVYAAVLSASGQPTGAALYGGFFLTLVTALANCLEQLAEPLLRCFLAVAAAGAISGSSEAAAVSGFLGNALQKAVKLAASAFTIILGMQRFFSASVDAAALKAGKALGSTVPVIGQTLTAAAESILAAGAVLKAGLGFAVVAVIGAEFLPFYLRTLLNLICIEGGVLMAKTLGLHACAQMLHCAAKGLETLSALAALFFSMIVVSSALMMSVGGG